jgi:hypothetical protein
MASEGARQKPYRVETVRGEPYRVGDRTLVPEARIVSYGRARATIGDNNVGGWAAGFVQATPLAVVEQTGEGERRIAVTDVTARTINLLLGTALAMTVAFTAIRCLVRSRRGVDTEV